MSTLRRLLPACVLGFLSTAGAAQTTYGPGGLFIHPTAYLPRKSAIGLNSSYFRQTEARTRHGEWFPQSLTYSVTDRLQVGGLYLHRSIDDQDEDGLGAFAKAQLLAEGPDRPAVALAGSYVGGDFRYSSVALVASRRFRAGGRDTFIGHVGAQYASRPRFDPSRPPDFEGPELGDSGLFVGGELPLGRAISLVAEAGTRFKFETHAESAIGLMWTGPGSLRVGIGVVNVGPSRDHGFFIGAGYGFGGNR